MSHARKQIRDAIVALCTLLPTTGGRVKAGAVHAVPDAAAPYLRIYTPLEASEPSTLARPRKLMRTTTVAIHGAASMPDEEYLLDALDQIAAEVEAALGADETLGVAGVKSTLLIATNIQLSGEGKQPAGAIRLDFQVTYRTTDGAPETLV